MKKIKLTKAVMAAMLCTLFGAAGAQNNLHTLMQGEQGRTAADTRLAPEQQVSFNPSQAKTIFGLDANSDLVLKRTETDNIGYVHYRYFQTWMGVPVENSMYIVHTKNGMLTGMSGSIILDFDKQTAQSPTASLTDVKAIEAALKFVHAQQYAWQDAGFEQGLKNQSGNAKSTYYPTANLAWYSAGDVINPLDLHLCYKIDVYALQPISRAYYFVDAQNGKVLGQKDELFYSDATGTCNTVYSGTQTIHSDLNAGSYRLRDLTKGNGVVTLHASGSHADYTNPSATWNLSGADQYALDAHYGVSQTWSFYKTNFNRNSVDNAGFVLSSWVNETSTVNNASWDGSVMHFGVRSGTSAGITAIDVTGHELTHGVTQYESGLNYSNQSGAMNESMSDIFGKSVQFWSKPGDINWLLSNDMNWNIRNMANPNQFSQPDTYLGTNWYTGTSDNGGVHTNSGVGNFMFYLLVTGGSGTNDIGNAYTVSGLGLTEADAILYRSQTTYLTPTSQYTNWRTACINAATDLYGASSNEVAQVENAWYAVGIGTPGAGCSDIYEPNNLKTTPATIPINTSVVGLITPSGDNDWFTITTVAPNTNLQITLSNLPADYNLRLFSSTNVLLKTSQNTGTANEVITRNVTTAATYKIRVYSITGANNATQCYTLTTVTSSTPLRTIGGDETNTDYSFLVSVYPNPVNDIMNLDVNASSDGNISINIVDMVGKTVLNVQKTATKGMNNFELSTKDLHAGIYFVEVNNGVDREIKKIVVSK